MSSNSQHEKRPQPARRRSNHTSRTSSPKDMEMNFSANDADVTGNGYMNGAFVATDDSNSSLSAPPNRVIFATPPPVSFEENENKIDTPKLLEVQQKNSPPKFLPKLTVTVRKALSSQHFRRLKNCALLTLWSAYVAAAWHLSGWRKASIIVVITAIVYFCLVIGYIIIPLLYRFDAVSRIHFMINFIFRRRYSRLCTTIAVSLALIVYIVVDGYSEPARFQSAIGIVVLTALAAAMSTHPRHIQWMTVVWGLLLQIIFGILVLKTTPGKIFFTFLSECVDGLLEFTNKGVAFVFGPHPEHHMFAFQVMPIVIFLSFIISALFYSGAMNFVIHYCGMVLYYVLGTTAVESVVAAANIFLGMTESPMVMRPFLKDVTLSELHAIVAGGFSSTSGSILAVYVTFGIDAVHMIAASVMSAPASLAMSKLFLPEVLQVKEEGYKRLPRTTGDEEDANILGAAFGGAMSTVKLVGYIIAGVLSAISALAMFNWLLGYLGSLVLINGLTFELISGYLLIPLAWTMGTPWPDCRQVGELIGIKTILNEFVAFEKLGVMIKAGTISVRAQIIATYALSGFSNLGSMGIMIGSIAALAPTRKNDVAKIVFRALIAGSFSCFMTACVASLLISESSHKNPYAASTTNHSIALPDANFQNFTTLNTTTLAKG